MTDSEDLYQIALLIDQLKHDDSALRTTASKSITKIAQALGPERTRGELIPFLVDCVDDEDEVISVIAEQLGELCKYVGGKEYVHVLLSPLELLICGEESSVRAKGIQSISEVVRCMAPQHTSAHFFPFLARLANKDWFTARASAAALVHLGYEDFSAKQREEVFTLFLKLSKDETPLVRRVAAQSLARMFQLSKEHNSSDIPSLLPAFRAVCADEQDSIRIQVVPICIAISDSLSEDIKRTEIMPAILAIAKDKSWRVRWSLAHKTHEAMCALKGNEEMRSALSAVFNSLLGDSEAEVRAAAASHLSTVAKYMDRAFVVSTMVPTSERLAADSSEFVRAFFATEINHLAPILGRDSAVKHILPLLLLLLRDENSEVRLNVISNLDAINSVIGVELLSQSLLPAISELAQDGKWRVRLAVIENIPMLSKQLGVQFFDDKLIDICMNWLSDTVYSIRRAAAENLKNLTDQFGEEWCKKQIIPKVQELHETSGFSQRLTALYALQVLAQSLSRSTVQKLLLPIILSMAGDAVANVRFNVAITLERAAYKAAYIHDPTSSLTQEVAAVLSKLAADLDRDVRFFAEKALAALKTSEGA